MDLGRRREVSTVQQLLSGVVFWSLKGYLASMSLLTISNDVGGVKGKVGRIPTSLGRYMSNWRRSPVALSGTQVRKTVLFQQLKQ